MTADRDLAIPDINGISRKQPQKPMKLIKEVRSGDHRDGVDRSIDSSLESKPVRVQLLQINKARVNMNLRNEDAKSCFLRL